MLPSLIGARSTESGHKGRLILVHYSSAGLVLGRGQSGGGGRGPMIHVLEVRQ
jgi:hypothetical protein